MLPALRQQRYQACACVACSQKLGQVLRGKSRARIGRSVQRYFPQCVACCSKQAGAVKSGATRLVLHYYGMRPWYYAGETP